MCRLAVSLIKEKCEKENYSDETKDTVQLLSLPTGKIQKQENKERKLHLSRQDGGFQTLQEIFKAQTDQKTIWS